MTWPFRRPSAPSSTWSHPLGYTKDDRRPDVFDPALKQYPNAFVHGAPTYTSDAMTLTEKRSRLLQRALVALGNSAVRDELVLRGSLTLERWFPGRARQAHDMDLVVRDATRAPDQAASEALLTSIASVVCGAIRGEVDVVDDQIALDSIWTYERAEGRRITIPWTSDASMRDVVQIDVVFQELLQDTPILEPLGANRPQNTAENTPAEAFLWFASRAESLAWKLLWLDTDPYPQAKDLYDAVLLAEHVALSRDLVHRVFAAKASPWKHGNDLQFIRSWRVDAKPFALEYPDLSFGVGPWLERLASSLRLVD